jgi:hypothetical protein
MVGGTKCSSSDLNHDIQIYYNLFFFMVNTSNIIPHTNSDQHLNFHPPEDKKSHIEKLIIYEEN